MGLRVAVDLQGRPLRTGTGRVVSVGTAAVSPPVSTEWAGANSGLPWMFGGYSGLSNLEALATNPSGGKVRYLDVPQMFSPYPKSWNGWQQTMADALVQNTHHGYLTRSNNPSPAWSFAVGPFSLGHSSTRYQRLQAQWPSQIGTIAADRWINPTVPVGFTQNSTATMDQKIQMALDVYGYASIGHFDHLWALMWQGLKQYYLIPYGLSSKRLILRPWWEGDSTWHWDSAETDGEIRTQSFKVCKTTSDANTCKLCFQRFCDVARTELPGVQMHFNPLTNSGMTIDGTISVPLKIQDWINPSTWDIIGPDYYDSKSTIKPNAPGDANARQLYTDRWNSFVNDTGDNGTLAGLNTWLNYVRNTARAINPNVRFGVGEWGLWDDTSSTDSGDDFVFIEKMYEAFAANSDIMAYESYFNKLSRHLITKSPSTHPYSEAAFTAKYGTRT